jgi:hypothetical protein
VNEVVVFDHHHHQCYKFLSSWEPFLSSLNLHLVDVEFGVVAVAFALHQPTTIAAALQSI